MCSVGVKTHSSYKTNSAHFDRPASRSLANLQYHFFGFVHTFASIERMFHMFAREENATRAAAAAAAAALQAVGDGPNKNEQVQVQGAWQRLQGAVPSPAERLRVTGPARFAPAEQRAGLAAGACAAERGRHQPCWQQQLGPKDTMRGIDYNFHAL